MNYLFLFLFTVLCKPGTIYEYDGTITEVWGNDKKEYYYYNLEYPNGTYLYVSYEKDSVWFLIENNFEYLYDTPKNEEFEIIK